jgi:hypothetical protein
MGRTIPSLRLALAMEEAFRNGLDKLDRKKFLMRCLTSHPAYYYNNHHHHFVRRESKGV